jgi:hypothetical protein
MINTRILNAEGITRFNVWLENPTQEVPTYLLDDDSFTNELKIQLDESRRFESRLEFGKYLNEIFVNIKFNQLMSKEYDGLWAWISLLYFNQLTAKGIRRKEHYIVIRKGSAGSLAYRNAARTSFELFYIHGENARICLSAQMATFGDLTEQLASRQSISHNVGFFKTATELYIKNGKLVAGASSKPKPIKLRAPNDKSGLGSVRRLALALQRLDLTYDTEEMTPEDMKKVLPKEFIKFNLLKPIPSPLHKC